MRPRVTAIVVAQNAAEVLARTLPAIEEQTRAPERRILVSLESRDDTEYVMQATAPDLLVTMPERTSFGEAVREAVRQLAEIDEGDAARMVADQHGSPSVGDLSDAVDMHPKIMAIKPAQTEHNVAQVSARNAIGINAEAIEWQLEPLDALGYVFVDAERHCGFS